MAKVIPILSNSFLLSKFLFIKTLEHFANVVFMHKDFNGWNRMKKGIDSKTSGRFYHEGEIWWCNLGLNVGNEQNGDSCNFKRPVLVIKALSRETFIALPLTTSAEIHKYRIDIGFIANKPAKVIISQIKVLDTKRLSQFVCILEEDLLKSIKKSVKDIF